MTNQASNLYLIERGRQRLVVGSLIAVIAVVAIGQRNQREMFSAVGRELPAPTAFAAFAEPEVILPVAAEDPLRRSRIFRLPPRAFQRRRASILPLATTPEGNAPVRLAALDPAVAGFVATEDAPPVPGATDIPGVVTQDEGGLAFDPIPTIGVVGNIPDEGDTNGEPTGPVTPSVPEPATWFMLLFGFAGIGAAMRRKNGLAVSAV
jgi:PEP-CTERM motif